MKIESGDRVTFNHGGQLCNGVVQTRMAGTTPKHAPKGYRVNHRPAPLMDASRQLMVQTQPATRLESAMIVFVRLDEVLAVEPHEAKVRAVA